MTEPHYKLAIVTGGIAGCAIAIRACQNGLANDNIQVFQNVAAIGQRAVYGQALSSRALPEGLRLHTAVLMDICRGATLVRVTYAAH